MALEHAPQLNSHHYQHYKHLLGPFLAATSALLGAWRRQASSAWPVAPARGKLGMLQGQKRGRPLRFSERGKERYAGGEFQLATCLQGVAMGEQPHSKTSVTFAAKSNVASPFGELPPLPQNKDSSRNARGPKSAMFAPGLSFEARLDSMSSTPNISFTKRKWERNTSIAVSVGRLPCCQPPPARSPPLGQFLVRAALPPHGALPPTQVDELVACGSVAVDVNLARRIRAAGGVGETRGAMLGSGTWGGGVAILRWGL